MALTKEQFLKMKEVTLQLEILVPLFKKMGFQDIHVHQGTSEHGKDIVMWKSGEFGERLNYAIVVKAKKVTGSVSSKSGASIVAAQINQCFGKTYLDHITTEEQRINRVYVVNSHPITKEAIEAIKGIIKNNIIDRATTFIDGNKLWEYIEKYIPEILLSIEEEYEYLKDTFSCPYCNAEVTTLGDSEYGNYAAYSCGYSFGSNYSSPCPYDPDFPTLDQYNLELKLHRDQWYCFAKPETKNAQKLKLDSTWGKTEEQARQRMKDQYNYKSKNVPKKT